MALVARCGSCGKQFQAQPQLAGKTVACPSCGSKLTVPKPAGAAATGTSRAATATASAPAAAAAHVVACQCGARFKANPQLAGKTVRCPTCNRPLRVPPAASSRQTSQGAAPPPADDFWDELLPKEKPKQEVVPKPNPVEKSMAGHQATAFAIDRLSKGHSPAQVRKELIEQGCNEVEANRVIESLAPEFKNKSVSSGVSSGASAGLKNMVIGGIVCFIGVAITVGSYVAAEPGGAFVLAYGPVIFGGIQFVRGLVQLVT